MSRVVLTGMTQRFVILAGCLSMLDESGSLSVAAPSEFVSLRGVLQFVSPISKKDIRRPERRTCVPHNMPQDLVSGRPAVQRIDLPKIQDVNEQSLRPEFESGVEL